VHFDDPAFREDALRGIGNTAQRIDEMIGRLTALRQRPHLNPVEADLNQLVSEALDRLDGMPQMELTRELQPLPGIRAMLPLYHQVHLLRVIIILHFQPYSKPEFWEELGPSDISAVLLGTHIRGKMKQDVKVRQFLVQNRGPSEVRSDRPHTEPLQAVVPLPLLLMYRGRPNDGHNEIRAQLIHQQFRQRASHKPD
jgi:hypothetical protein